MKRPARGMLSVCTRIEKMNPGHEHFGGGQATKAGISLRSKEQRGRPYENNRRLHGSEDAERHQCNPAAKLNL